MTGTLLKLFLKPVLKGNIVKYMITVKYLSSLAAVV